jgi:hypothetical protein
MRPFKEDESMRGTLCVARTGVIAALLLALATPAVHAAYNSHAEPDSELFFSAYPHLLGTRMDGCDACHVRTVGLPPGAAEGPAVPLSSCDSCHLITDHGRRPGDTLTSYGHDYLAAGRNLASLAAIGALDSDGDGFDNATELAAATHPGDPASTPESMPAPQAVLSLEGLRTAGVPTHQQTMFVNVSKSREGDSYSALRGFRLIEVLEAAGMDDAATSVDVISLDGYQASFSIAQLRRSYPQAAPVLGLDKETLGECGWVRYGAGELEAGVPLPDADVLLTFEINGERYTPASLGEGDRLRGSGPFRVVAPQMKSPGIPDLSSRADPACQEQVPARFHYNRDYEKNSDYCVKAVVAIRVNPLPAGTLDVNWSQDAAKVIWSESVIVFGALKGP